MSFGALLETALAGSNRQTVEAALPALQHLPPASRLLRSASYAGLRRLAGRQPDTAPHSLDPEEGGAALAVCAPERLPPIPESAGARLLKILRDRPGVLDEWLDLVAERNWRLSHDCLPEVLEYARSHTAIQDRVVQVGGQRLAWLAALNPNWVFALPTDAEERLAAGALQDRVRALRQIRRRDAARGRELLQRLFDARAVRADAAAALLGALADGLSAEDEQLLLRAIQDPRQDLRNGGLRLIRRIPHSQFGQRWAERARKLVAIGDSPAELPAQVREPETRDPLWVLDGLEPRAPKGIGPTAWLLQQVVALTPPSIWRPATLEAFRRSEWSQPLLSGLAQAAVAYADADWCERLLGVTSQGVSVRGVHSAALLAELSLDRAEALVDRLLETRDAEAIVLATGLKGIWSENFSRQLLGRLPAVLGKYEHAVSALLREAQLHLAPEILADARQLLVGQQLQTIWASSALERLVRTLEFRLAMRAELEPA